MGQTVLRITFLPEDPLEAAAHFYAEDMIAVRAILEGRGPCADIDALAIIFPPAGHQHRAWRLAAVQGLARRASPRRVNGVTGKGALDAATDWLARAPGVTGQLLTVG